MCVGSTDQKPTRHAGEHGRDGANGKSGTETDGDTVLHDGRDRGPRLAGHQSQGIHGVASDDPETQGVPVREVARHKRSAKQAEITLGDGCEDRAEPR